MSLQRSLLWTVCPSALPQCAQQSFTTHVQYHHTNTVYVLYVCAHSSRSPVAAQIRAVGVQLGIYYHEWFPVGCVIYTVCSIYLAGRRGLYTAPFSVGYAIWCTQSVRSYSELRDGSLARSGLCRDEPVREYTVPADGKGISLRKVYDGHCAYNPLPVR